jgi:beta-galactosidase
MSYLGETKYYKEVADAGVHLYCFPAYLGERGINSESGIGPFRPPIWIGDNQYDFSAIIKDFTDIVKADPQARIIIRFYLDPPLWWEKLNPEAACQLGDGRTFRQCFSSTIWREETGESFQHCLEWLLNSPYSEYLVGIHVASGFTEEWFYHPRQYLDKNPVRIKAFRQWLREKYQYDTSALQRSWNNKSVNFKNAQLANILELEKRSEWRNQEQKQNIIDTFRFHSQEMVKNIAYFCKIVKKVSKRNLLTGAFYGYHYYVVDPKRGHGALSKLLDCLDLDYLSSPNVYNRVIGEDWPPMVAVQSVKLHGKLWLAENDTRTSIATLLKDRSFGIAPPGQYETGVWRGPHDMETSVSFLWKNAGRMLCYGYGGWWFDMWGGWFSHPELLNVVEKTQQYYSQYQSHNKEKMTSQVCVFVDEELCFWDGRNGKLVEKILSNRYPLAKTGTSYDLFLRMDMAAIPKDQYKVIWILGVLELKAEELILIEKWQQQGITVMWTDLIGTSIYRNGENKTLLKDKFRWSALQLRKLWRRAGVHVYVDTDDVFYVGNNWLCIHTILGGNRTIKFPFFTQIIGPHKKQVIADSTKSIDINLAPKSTTLFRINPHDG